MLHTLQVEVAEIISVVTVASAVVVFIKQRWCRRTQPKQEVVSDRDEAPTTSSNTDVTGTNGWRTTYYARRPDNWRAEYYAKRGT